MRSLTSQAPRKKCNLWLVRELNLWLVRDLCLWLVRHQGLWLVRELCLWLIYMSSPMTVHDPYFSFRIIVYYQKKKVVCENLIEEYPIFTVWQHFSKYQFFLVYFRRFSKFLKVGQFSKKRICIRALIVPINKIYRGGITKKNRKIWDKFPIGLAPPPPLG